MKSSENSYAAYKIGVGLLLLAILLGCKIVIATPLPTELVPATAVPGQVVAQAAAAGVVVATEPAATPLPEGQQPAPVLTPTPVATSFFLQSFSAPMNESPERKARALPRHGLMIAFVLPMLVFGIPWMIFEFFTIRYVQPRGFDLSTVRIKAQDGLFIEATASMTARRTLSMASMRMTWPNVKDFMEKTIEQELIHEALNFPSLEDLERNLKIITEKFLELPALKELYRDFGVEVLRFNIESRYPQETMDALNRKAEASAGGAAYLAYAAAAHLDPDTQESRELYRIYQQTTSRVDAARNLGGGIASVAGMLRREEKKSDEEEKKK